MSDHAGLPPGRILVGQVSQNPTYTWCFLLLIFPLLTSTMLLGYKCPLVHTIFGVEPNVSLHYKILLQWCIHLSWWSWIRSTLPPLASFINNIFFNNRKNIGNNLNVHQNDNGKIKHVIFRVQSAHHYTMKPTCDLHTWSHLYWVIVLPYFRPPHSGQGTIDQSCHGQALPSFTEMLTESCPHFHFWGVKGRKVLSYFGNNIEGNWRNGRVVSQNLWE